MPSGITHMLISRNLPIDDDTTYKFKKLYNTKYFQLGSISPDLPYGAIADNHFLDNEDEIANLFHFAVQGQSSDQSPNKLPLLGLRKVKEMWAQGSGKRACDALFWFLTGFASHVIADGICHPYVMDKVGRYEGPNKAEHRALEMGIDVLLFKHFTADSGHTIEASYAGMDQLIASFDQLNHINFIFEHFMDLIDTVYGKKISVDEIKQWVVGISRLFTLSTGKWPGWLRHLDATTSFVFRQTSDLESRKEEYLVLNKPKFWDSNFLGAEKIHFIEDCLPRYNKAMKSFLDRAYAYVYESGPSLMETDLPAFSLDTGRTVHDFDNAALKPTLWEVA